MRKRFSAVKKAEVALDALAGRLTVNELAAKHEVHPTQIKAWKEVLRAGASGLFHDKRCLDTRAADLQAQIDELHRVIGKRDAELEWLKKKTALDG